MIIEIFISTSIFLLTNCNRFLEAIPILILDHIVIKKLISISNPKKTNVRFRNELFIKKKNHPKAKDVNLSKNKCHILLLTKRSFLFEVFLEIVIVFNWFYCMKKYFAFRNMLI